MLVRQVMTATVVTVSHTATVRQAIRLLYERNITAAPVVNGRDQMVGIVSRRDLMGVPARSDERIHDDVVEALGEYATADGSRWDVTLRDGVVELRGRADIAEGHVADVLARTVPGGVRVVRVA